MPADPGLQLFTGNIVINIIVGQHGSHFVSSHHACIASKDVNVIVAHLLMQIVEHIVDLKKRQPILVFRSVVKAHSRFRSGSVIPQNGHGSVGRIFREAIAKEFQQAVLAAHGFPAPVGNRLKISVPQCNQVSRIALNLIKIPFLGAAR